jgi:hypothetical protein
MVSDCRVADVALLILAEIIGFASSWLLRCLGRAAELYRQVQVGSAGLMMSRAEIKAKPRPIDSEIIWRDCVDVASSTRRLDPRARSNDSTTRGIGVTSPGGSQVPMTSLDEVRRIQPVSKQIPEVEQSLPLASTQRSALSIAGREVTAGSVAGLLSLG